MAPRLCLSLMLSTTLLLSGCTNTRNYNAELGETTAQLSAGNVDAALAVLERNNPMGLGDLLYYLEKGELLRAKGDLNASFATWSYADQVIVAWEDSAKINRIKQFTHLNSYIFNDKVRFYDGYDYEKVALTTQMALNLLAVHDLSNARVEIKKTHEREATIAERRDMQYLEVENQAEAQGISLRYQDLQGYPVATLDAPEVIALKNSYQSAFSHYLAGFVYEALGEKDLAAPGYRKAIELRPNTPLLEQALNNLGKPSGKAGESDVLIIVQTGLAPERSSVRLPMAVDVDGETIITNMSFPIIIPDTSTPPFSRIIVDGRKQRLTLLNSIGEMSRRALRDDMPGIILRTTYRARTHALTLANLKKHHPEQLPEAIARQTLLEDADTRAWRTLPDNTFVARLRLKQGVHSLALPNAPEIAPIKIRIDQPFQAFSLRALSNRVYASDIALLVEPTAEPKPVATAQKP